MTCSLQKIILTIFALFSALLLSSCQSPQLLPNTHATHSIYPSEDTKLNQDKTIAILGGTGMAGKFLVEEALARGFRVRALARTPKKLEKLKDRVTIVSGDALDPLAIDDLLQGSDMVVSALGPVKSDGQLANYISTKASALVIKSMQKHNIKRVIVVSGGAVKIPGDHRNFTGWLIEKLASIRYRSTLKDKQSEYQLLADSTLDWTIVRCPLIADQPFKNPPKASLVTPTAFYLRAGELAQFVITQLSSDEFVKKGPFLASH